MKVIIALNSNMGVAEAGEKIFASLSASRLDSAKAKIGRLEALIAKTKSAANYKTSDRLKASVARRTGLIKELKATVKELEKTAKAKPAAKAVKPATKPAVKPAADKSGIDPTHPDHKAMLKHLDRAMYESKDNDKHMSKFKKAAVKVGFNPESAAFLKKAEKHVNAALRAKPERAPKGERKLSKTERERLSNMLGNKPESAAPSGKKTDHTGRPIRVTVKPSSKPKAPEKKSPKRKPVLH